MAAAGVTYDTHEYLGEDVQPNFAYQEGVAKNLADFWIRQGAPEKAEAVMAPFRRERARRDVLREELLAESASALPQKRKPEEKRKKKKTIKKQAPVSGCFVYCGLCGETTKKEAARSSAGGVSGSFIVSVV